MVPERFAVRPKRGQDALSALDENIAGFAIHRRARGGVAQINGVAEEIVVEMLPPLLAGFSIETRDAFLEISPIAEIAHDVKLAVRDDGRGLAGEIGAPENILHRQLVGQTRLARNADLVRSAPA